MNYSEFKRIGTGNRPYFFFNSINELAQITEAHIGKSNWENPTSEANRAQWSGTESLQEAIRLLKYGWQEGIASLNKEISLSINKGMTFKSEYNVVGGQASVPRYLQGIPTNMILQKQVEKQQKIIDIYKSISYSANVKANQIKEESKKAIQLIQNLENQGYRTNLYVYFGSYVKTEQMFVCVKIKSSGEKLNISKMAFPLMHPSMLRRIFLKAVEHADWIGKNGNKRRWASGYGTPFNGDYIIRPYVRDSDIHIPAIIGNLDNFIKNLNLKSR